MASPTARPGGPPPTRLWIGIAAAVVAAAAVTVLLLVVVRPGSGGYDDATRDAFLEACTADGGAGVASACACVYDRIATSVPYDRFEEVDHQLAAQDVEPGTPLELPADIEAIVAACRS